MLRISIQTHRIGIQMLRLCASHKCLDFQYKFIEIGILTRTIDHLFFRVQARTIAHCSRDCTYIYIYGEEHRLNMLSGFTSDVWRTGSNAVRTRCGQLAHEDKALREPKPKKGQEAKALNGSSKSAHRIPGKGEGIGEGSGKGSGKGSGCESKLY